MNSANRRRYPRYESEIDVMILTNVEKISATIIDIGRSGFGVISEKVIKPGTQVLIVLKFFDEYAINGIVKWISQFGQNQKIFYRMGIEAENIIWTDLKAIGFPKWDDLVAKILSDIGKQKQGLIVNPPIDNKISNTYLIK